MAVGQGHVAEENLMTRKQKRVMGRDDLKASSLAPPAKAPQPSNCSPLRNKPLLQGGHLRCKLWQVPVRGVASAGDSEASAEAAQWKERE